MNKRDYYNTIVAAWKFFSRWLDHDQLTPADWDAIVTEANAAVEPLRDRPGGKFATELFTAAVSELERVKT